jgi:uncharacterized protein (TIGR02058 family)
MKKRFIVEFGTGADLHGGNVTKAAGKALRDAISHCCLSGLTEVANVKDAVNNLSIEVKIATPNKEALNLEEALKSLPPYRNITAEVVDGGMTVRGTHAPSLGEGDTITIVNAAITVCIND